MAVIDDLLIDFKRNAVLEPMVDLLKIQYLENIEHKVALSESCGLDASRMPVPVKVFIRARSLFRGAK